MLELMTRRWWLVVLRGVVAIAFGLAAIAWPRITLLALVVLWGAYTLLDGVAAVAIGVSRRDAHAGDRAMHLLLGVLGIAAGLVALVWPDITVVALLVVIAVWAIVAGAVQLATAVRLRRVIRNEWFLALAGVTTVVLGVLLIVQPAEGALALVVAIATFTLVWGVVLVLLGLRLRRIGRVGHL